MPVTIKVNGASNSLVHKGSNGVSVATIPDVCKTPTPGGPVPIPYPNISQSITLAKGTTTVKADGGMMIAIKGSEFSLSNGDNPGVAGGVKSSTFMKESTWILYSFDVKMDGKNACRLTDKKFQNHENTVDIAGAFQIPVIPAGLTDIQMIACAIHCCDTASYKKRDHKDEGKDCRSLSVTKHSCVMHALRTSKAAKKAGIKASPRFPRPGKRTLIPDVMFGDRIIDAKFPCKKTVPAPLKGKWESDLTKTSAQMMTQKERTDYKKIPGVKKVDAMTPRDAAKKRGDCKCTYKKR
ncbi:DUF4150 domain-containing protein [Pseudoduganella albidiflava]|uniref:DUF4150 domain-containing protein n=1 Tax=Pseudoduganella albidiflava TaxID=321983 RepID=A0A411WX94_9BURK|nr:DUF4150 domain-containing protein [Pseudoduganella albidiflava]QBI01289.1 DUF4150 domain-containing protein [Pseudoduganella albidiflava]GGY36860.1 hypothetical protein GCM10007387_19000 [Pseudoduganella albidiflava]